MHCAAFYGHYNLVSLLLANSVPLNIKNCFDNLPEEEAATPEISKLFEEAKGDPIMDIFQQLYKLELAVSHI